MKKHITYNPASISVLLTEAGIKPSAQRIAVTSYMLTHRTHPTAEEIYKALHPDYPTISLTTVYNTLKRLVEAGAIKSLNVDQTTTRFDGATDDHAHFVCTKCGSITDVELLQQPIAPNGFDIAEMQVTLRGVCRQCQSQQ